MIGAAALGGLAGVDRTAFAQTMLSHPVICGTLAGWIAGDPSSGLRLGIVFGMLASRRAPIGGEASVLDWTTASVAVPFALGGAAAGWQWGLGTIVGLVAAIAGGRLIRFVRLAASRQEVGVERALRAGDFAPLERVHLGWLLLHFLRGAAMTAAAAWLAGQLAFSVPWSGPEQSAAAMLWAFAPVTAAFVLVESHTRRGGWLAVLTGAAAAVLLVVAAGVTG